MAPINRNKHSQIPGADGVGDTPSDKSPTSQLAAQSIPTFGELLRNRVQLDVAALDSLNLKLAELAISNEINTSVRREMPKVLSRNRQLLAKNIILKR